MPNLIEVQRASYEQFLQMHTSPDKRDPDGLEAVFKIGFPDQGFLGPWALEYISFEFEQPKFDVQECMQRDSTSLRPEGETAPDRVRDDEETGASRSRTSRNRTSISATSR
jgi:DNA-directed RNA polymerase subunit beta